MKLSVILTLSLAFVFLIIGLYEMMVLGPKSGYWSIMLAIALLFWYMLRKNAQKD